jgi:formamidopyrimidine-DNA glycosylase
MLEVEAYRRQAETVVGRTIGSAELPDTWFVKGSDPAEVAAAVAGRRVEAVRRLGKLLVLDLDGGTRLGLRFGMTGRLVVDGAAAIDRLEYSSGRDEPAWDRFALRFTDGTELRVRDPRRQGAALDGLCPRDGTPLVRRTVGGRTTLSCPRHQR